MTESIRSHCARLADKAPLGNLAEAFRIASEQENDREALRVIGRLAEAQEQKREAA